MAKSKPLNVLKDPTSFWTHVALVGQRIRRSPQRPISGERSLDEFIGLTSVWSILLRRDRDRFFVLLSLRLQIAYRSHLKPPSATLKFRCTLRRPGADGTTRFANGDTVFRNEHKKRTANKWKPDRVRARSQRTFLFCEAAGIRSAILTTSNSPIVSLADHMKWLIDCLGKYQVRKIFSIYVKSEEISEVGRTGDPSAATERLRRAIRPATEDRARMRRAFWPNAASASLYLETQVRSVYNALVSNKLTESKDLAGFAFSNGGNNV
jgi:hypothetical protein